ncbi:MAG: MerR family transcriptional regulator [Proteobacteria bacterium]|nr:MerR family transcriptional regulator [Pseudomonadota bacterium]
MASRIELPDKLYFKIGEVANLTGVKQHVLRYWESEFASIRPQKSKSNQRLYRRRDVEAVIAIRHLLHERKFTIEGAKKHLKKEGIISSLPPPDPNEIAARARREALNEMKDESQKSSAELTRKHEKQLLGLRQQLVEYIKDLDNQDQE